MLQFLMVGHAPWPLTHTAEPTAEPENRVSAKRIKIQEAEALKHWNPDMQVVILTCSCAADDAVVDEGDAVDRDL